MRIERLDLAAYGHYAETTLDLSRPAQGLTVVWGPNEAGKSTARRALLAALFGFGRNDPDAHRYSTHGLRLGVRLSAAADAELSFVRQGLSRVVDADGAPLTEDVVERFRGGIGRALYTRLFSIDHDELRTGSESLLDADGEIGRLVYGAGLGTGSVPALLHRLDERADRLFQERGRVQQIPKALEGYRAGMQAAKAARVRSRDWDRLHQAVDHATDQAGRVRDDLVRARAEQARLVRIRSARPLLARRAAAMERLTELGAVPSEDWADRAAEALAGFRDARAAHDSAVDARSRLDEQTAEVAVDEPLLDRAERIDKLVQGVDRYRKDSDDVPKRRTELEGALGRLSAQLRVLGRSSDDGSIVAESDLMVVEELAREHVKVMAEQRTTVDELRHAEGQVAAARARLSRLPQPPDVAALDRALRLARPKVELAREVAAGRAAQVAAAADLVARAGRLGLAALDQSEIEALVVPAEGDVDAERERRTDLRHQLAQLDGERDDLASQVGTLEVEMAAVSTALPDPGRLGAAREHREAGWRVVRRVLDGDGPVDPGWAGGAPLAEAYEAAVTDADRAADERYDHAGEMAALAGRRDRLAELDDRRRRLDERRQALVDGDGAAAAAWADRWAAVGVTPGTPEAMAGWLRDQRELVAAIGAWRQGESRLDAGDREVARQRRALAAELAEQGHGPGSDALDLLVAQAEQVVAEAGTAADARRGVATELRLAEEAEPQRRTALERHEAAVSRWREEWAVALRPLSLTSSVDPAAATTAVAAHRALAAARDEVAALRRRIEGIEADRSDYVAQVVGTAAGVLPGTRDRTPLDAVAELQRCLGTARAALQRREALGAQLRLARGDEQEAAVRLDDARRSLAFLRVEAALGTSAAEPDSGMGTAVDRARTAASLRRNLEEWESDLLEQGDGRGIEEIVAEAAGAGDTVAGDTVAGDLDAVSAEVDALVAQGDEATSQRAAALAALEAVTDGAGAADLEQDAQAELAVASELATDYARTALAADVLRRTIADYGERHRGPLLDRAGQLFRRLTDDAFTELVADVDGDRQLLLARRRGGELCAAPVLSDGTRDQLYLALRLAGVEHQLGVLAERPPVVLDDILVHFDDTRAAAALTVLAELGRHAQVLLLTHHQRVVDIARRELAQEALAVVSLAPRDHDQPPPTVAGASPLPGRRAGPGAGGQREAAEREILAAASGAAGHSLTKSELLARSGVAEAQWPAAIRSLVGRGAVVQEGQKRGARYRLSGPAGRQ